MTDAVPATVRASWEQAEAQLYQVVMIRPDLYQRAVVLVGRLSDVLLAECPDLAGLDKMSVELHRRQRAAHADRRNRRRDARPGRVRDGRTAPRRCRSRRSAA